MKRLLTLLIFILVTTLQAQTITIGKQVWMTENLNVDTFRNGEAIPAALTDAEWEMAGENKQPAWCYYENDPGKAMMFGFLYNWYAVNDTRGLCPTGWHVPSADEWAVLTDFCGEDAGTKMKSMTTWYENGNGTNSSGFDGLAAGNRWASGSFVNNSTDGYWWSSNEHSAGDAGYLGLGHEDGRIYIGSGRQGNGFSVRCLRD